MGKDTRILITGASGFIGRFLVAELRERGYTDLTALVRPSSDIIFLKKSGVKFITADITDEASLRSVPAEFDAIFHCAGTVGLRDKKALRAINVKAAEYLCRFALECGVKRFIHVSSVAVNSANKEVVLTEEMPYKPQDDYGVSKMEGEKIVLGFRKAGLPVVVVRPCMVYGEGEPHLMRLLVKLLKAHLFFLPGRGNNRRHLVSVRNVASCLVRCLDDERAVGKTFHIADNDILTTRQIAEIICGAVGAPLPWSLPRFAEVILSKIPLIGGRIALLSKDRVYSISRLKDALDFIPPHPAKVELARAAAYFK